jgi:hypothetical protein
MYLGATSTAVKVRQNIEKRIVLSLIDELLAQGFFLSVYDGEETSKPSRDKEAIVKAIMETDEDYLYAHRSEKKEWFGWIRLVYGNDGYDVMSDATVNMDALIPKTLAIVNELDS